MLLQGLSARLGDRASNEGNMKSHAWFVPLLSLILVAALGCGKNKNPFGGQASDVCIIDTGSPNANVVVAHVAEIFGSFYLVGDVVEPGVGPSRLFAAVVHADCVMDDLLITSIGTNPYNVARIVTPTRDGRILIRGGTHPAVPPPSQYYTMVLDRGLNPNHTEIDQSLRYFSIEQYTPYPDGTVVLIGDAGATFGLRKENADGSPVMSFGARGDGNVTISFRASYLSNGRSATLQSDGQILFAVGEVTRPGGVTTNAVASLTPDGRMLSTNSFNAAEGNAELSVASASRTGSGFVGATWSIPPGGGNIRSFLYCASDDLTVDTSCGTDGWTEITLVPNAQHWILGLARREGGYVGLATSCSSGGQCRPFLFCADENIGLDTRCAQGGLRVIDLGLGDNFARALITRSNGTYIAAINSCPSPFACRPAFTCFGADLSPIDCQ